MTDLLNNQSDDDAQVNEPSGAQGLMIQWQWPIAFGPFVLLLVVAQMPIANAIPKWMVLPLIFATVIWAVAFKGYLLYLTYQK